MIRLTVETHDGVQAELELPLPAWDQEAALSMVVAMDKQIASLAESSAAARAAATAALRSAAGIR